MVKVFTVTALMIAMGTLTACVSTQDITVKSEKSAKADLSGYKTYSILASSGVDKAFRKDKNDDGVKSRNEINRIINETLQKQGKSYADKNPDFYVVYAAGTDKNAIEKKLSKEGKEVIHNTPKAAIVLVLIDAKNGSVLWKSSAEGDLQNISEEKKRQRMSYAIKKMLANL